MIVIAGKNAIAVSGLRLAIENFPHRDVAVVCNRGETGSDSWQPSLRKAAKLQGIPEISLFEAYRNASVFLSLEFDQIVDVSMFNTRAVYNMHFSKLPAYKGMYTSIWPLLHGNRTAGVSLHVIDSGIDTGDIIDQHVFEIKPWWVSRDLYFAFNSHGRDLLYKNLKILTEKPVVRAQSPFGSTYYSKKSVRFDAVELDFNHTAWSLCQYVKAFSFREYQLVRYLEKALVNADILPVKSSQRPGTVLVENENFVDVATIDYNVRLYFDRLESLLECCRSDDLENFQALEKNIAGFNDCNERGWSPAIVSSYYGAHRILERLIAHGADVNRPSNKGTVPLMYAKNAFAEGRGRLCFDMLVSSGADVNVKDYLGKSVMDYISEDPSLSCLRASTIK